jgi:hypothetical protein
MDDPTRRCENDIGIWNAPSGLPVPSGGPIFLCLYEADRYSPGVRSTPPVEFSDLCYFSDRNGRGVSTFNFPRPNSLCA